MQAEYKQKGHSGPESLTSLYFVQQSYKLMRLLGRPILAEGHYLNKLGSRLWCIL